MSDPLQKSDNVFELNTGYQYNIETDPKPNLDFLEPIEIKGIKVEDYLNNFNQNSYVNNSIAPIDPTMLTTLTTQSLNSLNLSSIPPINTITTNTGTINTLNTGSFSNNPQGTYSFTDSFVTEKTVEKLVKKEIAPILKRLAILDEPSPEILEKFFSLKEAYNHYKTIEGLLYSEIEKLKNP